VVLWRHSGVVEARPQIGKDFWKICSVGKTNKTKNDSHRKLTSFYFFFAAIWFQVCGLWGFTKESNGGCKCRDTWHQRLGWRCSPFLSL
jgi:hypothetical protein